MRLKLVTQVNILLPLQPYISCAIELLYLDQCMSCLFDRVAQPVCEGSLADMKSAALGEMEEVSNTKGVY